MRSFVGLGGPEFLLEASRKSNVLSVQFSKIVEIYEIYFSTITKMTFCNGFCTNIFWEKFIKYFYSLKVHNNFSFPKNEVQILQNGFKWLLNYNVRFFYQS